MRPVLQLLKDVAGVKYIHRDVLSIEELRRLIVRWPQQQYRRYSVGYFALHGTTGHVTIGREALSLSSLAETLGRRCSGKIAYFAGCGVIDVARKELEAFLRATGARCVAGYTDDVDWIDSAAFDLLFLEAATWYRRMDAIDNWLRKEHGSFSRRMGFRMHYA